MLVVKLELWPNGRAAAKQLLYFVVVEPRGDGSYRFAVSKTPGSPGYTAPTPEQLLEGEGARRTGVLGWVANRTVGQVVSDVLRIAFNGGEAS